MIRKLTTKLKRILIPIERMLSVIRRDRLTVYAGQASYFVLMSSVPLVMLLVSLFGAIYPLDGDAILALTAEFLPEQLRDFGGKLLSGVFNTSAVPLASVSTVVLLWAASRGIRTIGDGIQNIFDEGARRSYVRNVIVSLLYTLAFLMLILLALLMLVFGAPLQDLIRRVLGENSVLYLVFDLKNIILFVLLTAVFMLAYGGLAKSDIPFRGQFFGAAVAAGGWLLFSFFFSIYIKYFSKYPYLYGGLAALLLLMLWLNILMVILLFGAELNKWRRAGKIARGAKKRSRKPDSPLEEET